MRCCSPKEVYYYVRLRPAHQSWCYGLQGKRVVYLVHCRAIRHGGVINDRMACSEGDRMSDGMI